jgi:dolichol-phosphate mannosyltransferase
MLSVIIPTYNEVGNIEILISRLENLIEEDHEIIVVDDNSPDGTSSIVTKLSKKYSNLKLVKRKRKEGLASAILAGVEASKGQDIVVMDADLSHPPELVPKIASDLSDHDLVIGSRLIEGGGVKDWPFHRKLISKIAEFLARKMLNIKSTDPLSGFFAIRKEIFNNTKTRIKGYKILLNLLNDNPDIRIKEFPYLFEDRHKGKTKLGLYEVIEYVLDLFRLRFG